MDLDAIIAKNLPDDTLVEKSAQDPERRRAKEVSRQGSQMEPNIGKPGEPKGSYWSKRTPGKRKHGGYADMGSAQKSHTTGKFTGGPKVAVDPGGDTGKVPGARAPAAGTAAHKAARGVKKTPGAKPASALKQRLQKKYKKEEIGIFGKMLRTAYGLEETAVNPMGAPSNAPIGRSVIGNTAPEKVSPVKGSVTTQASPSGSIPGESGMGKVMDKINRIVKSGHSEKIHDKVIDKDTASAIQSTYAKVNAANQEKMEKVMSKDAASMEKISKFSKKNA
jgi:hypothetical protein